MNKIKSEIISQGKYLNEAEIDKYLSELTRDIIDAKINNLLLIPPDYTRKSSALGPITEKLYFKLVEQVKNIEILPASGTHDPMDRKSLKSMFGEIPSDRFLAHNWRSETIKVGEIPAAKMKEFSQGELTEAIPLEINRHLFDDKYDLIISIGQVIPHEVVGMANYTKNIVVGCGGDQIINKSHFLGALAGMEKIMGKDHSPVRKLYDYCQQKFLAQLPLLYLMSVNSPVGDSKTGLTKIKGIFAGSERDSFEKAVALSQQQNIIKVEKPLEKVVVYLKEDKFKSTWIGGKAIYRTRMAVADGGDLIIIAPGIHKFGEDKEIDRLLRKYGYRGTEKTLENLHNNSELQENLSAAAHLIHGSSEGRFTISLASPKLSQQEIEAINFNYLDYQQTIEKYKIDELENGFNNVNEEEIFYINNPATGLWVYQDK
ncbi:MULTISPECIES: lactate racemase domain-containing protein [Halanaerobium]|jgi:nickel-dependent lactate racemase|uniref:Nickel-dependent lactate racemase n=1 Tax=Halanaerobium kushneri TaxID=56779 RepID=A0A1N6RIM9_9FIRM|nr:MULTISPECIES: lactate racemase domain-containing protein [Halanaerobium]RCW58629.1 nickel-dependent lactate racemase [Halanaerobium sp. ST460_2HS_T2]SIQ28665.1 Nickel-dependent lactate racemase [Halanaerobium kushneri]